MDPMQMLQQMQLGQRPDEGLNVEFYEGSKRDDKASDELKKEVFKPVTMVRICIPGNRDEMIDTEAWLDDTLPKAHNQRFPFAWARFKSQDKAGDTSGFPLKEWSMIGRSVVETLAHLNIKTVEQLASISDGNLQNIPLPNPPELRQRAKDFLLQANSAETLRAELNALRAQMEAMKAASLPSEPNVRVVPQGAVAALAASLEQAPEAAPAAPVRRRGRPPKSVQP